MRRRRSGMSMLTAHDPSPNMRRPNRPHDRSLDIEIREHRSETPKTEPGRARPSGISQIINGQKRVDG